MNIKVSVIWRLNKTSAFQHLESKAPLAAEEIINVHVFIHSLRRLLLKQQYSLIFTVLVLVTIEATATLR